MAQLREIAQAWKIYCASALDSPIQQQRPGRRKGSAGFKGQDVSRSLRFLCERGLGEVVMQHFMDELERSLKENYIPEFWSHFTDFLSVKENSDTKQLNEWIHSSLPVALEKLCSKKVSQEDGLNALIKALETNASVNGSQILTSHQTTVTALLLTTSPSYFSDLLKLYFTARLEEFSGSFRKRPCNSDDEDCEASTDVEDMDVLGVESPCKGEAEATEVSEDSVSVRNVVKRLRDLGFAALCEEAYASAILSLLKKKIYSIADKRYEKPVLGPIRHWIEAVPMRFLSAILESSAGSSSLSPLPATPSPLASSSTLSDLSKERIIRWRLRLQFFTYETLGDLRISELFDVIVDYPDSLPAIEDLRQCLANTGEHSKLVKSFRLALKQRLLTAGAATTDILTQYVSTIKALRTMDPTGVILEAVGEPIREYLRGRKDTIRCIVTMLTDDTATTSGTTVAGGGEGLLEELSRGTTTVENADSDEEGELDGEEAWAAAQRWEPDPVEADLSRTSKSRRSMDIISMLVGIYGSKELFVNEYRVMLAEKLLNKSDYDTDREIRTLELLKLRFGENNMHSCEIMLKDLADSKRINSNIKAKGKPQETFQKGEELTLHNVDATVISSLFWPPFQTETLQVPDFVDKLLDDYAQQYHTVKAPRKLQWKKHLGTVKLELQFEDRSAQFVVSPMQASIILKFESCSRWSASELAAASGIPVTTLRRRIVLWINQGVLVESHGDKDGEVFYQVVETIGDGGQRGASAPTEAAVPLLEEEDGQSAVTPMEDQWQQEMNVYESYIVGMLTNLESLPLDRIHNMLKMFVSDPPYDKTLQQLQGFLGSLIADEKLEFREGVYRRKQ
ncbi:anaphase-promoting complex subunit 2 isoform X1 [Selaginella moellendorffii]|uniref:anaphase-promoting complex subunit 2 isoform X1 n=1 Tax=Selaginella moellendorffii TaxID=88036 RepID=UPI000D1C8621|nr:anaphase-promoting complex subunit 2 isoform X1 [Selaginella moellendorffii]|eukprot:XP_024541138.1 anaphase-promoting complex subunit 2 isoform X1 [Selaginella moellendorffii]